MAQGLLQRVTRVGARVRQRRRRRRMLGMRTRSAPTCSLSAPTRSARLVRAAATSLSWCAIAWFSGVGFTLIANCLYEGRAAGSGSCDLAVLVRQCLGVPGCRIFFISQNVCMKSALACRLGPCCPGPQLTAPPVLLLSHLVGDVWRSLCLPSLRHSALDPHLSWVYDSCVMAAVTRLQTTVLSRC